jgi:S-adenosylmethionine synthetase
MNNNYLFTSESVTEGHPDKIADQISDAIIDELYKQDIYSKAVLETMVTKGLILVAGKVTTKGYYDIYKIIRDTVREIGYTQDGYGFSCDTFNVFNSIEEEPADIAIIGPQYQGVVHGYACIETPELMPLPISLANKLTYRLDELRRKNILPYLLPDGKVMVTVHYMERFPRHVETIELLTQHQPNVNLDELRKDVLEKVIKEVVPEIYLDKNTQYYINPTGRFVIGGPVNKTGMTGRKIAADTYGGFARNGGGSFSGKDPNHLDRWGSYNARYIAKNIVAAGFAERCEIQITYVKGKEDPVSIMVETFGTENVAQSTILRLIKDNFYFTHPKVMEYLDLGRPIYKKIAVYGHFGREDKEFSWEKTDKVEDLQKSMCRPNKTQNNPVLENKNNGSDKDFPSSQPWPENKAYTYIRRYNIPIDINVEGNKVEGAITRCNWKSLSVRINRPYQNLASGSGNNSMEMAAGCPSNIDNDGNLTDKCIKRAECMLRELYWKGKKIQQIKVRLIMDENYLERTRMILNYTRALIYDLQFIFYRLPEYPWEEKDYIYSLIKRKCMLTFFYDTFPEVSIPDNLGEEIIKIIDGDS